MWTFDLLRYRKAGCWRLLGAPDSSAHGERVFGRRLHFSRSAEAGLKLNMTLKNKYSITNKAMQQLEETTHKFYWSFRWRWECFLWQKQLTVHFFTLNIFSVNKHNCKTEHKLLFCFSILNWKKKITKLSQCNRLVFFLIFSCSVIEIFCLHMWIIYHLMQ